MTTYVKIISLRDTQQDVTHKDYSFMLFNYAYSSSFCWVWNGTAKLLGMMKKLMNCKEAKSVTAWTVFAREDAVIVVSKATQGMDVRCVYIFLCLCFLWQPLWSSAQSS
jgi:hypothetical protein